MARSKVYLQVDRVAAEVCAAARTVSVSDLHESMGTVPGRQTMMAPTMRPLIPRLRIAGPAVTASCAPHDNLMMHRALYLARQGDVLVVQAAKGGAQWGDIAARYAIYKGLQGVVVDGFIRDTDELVELSSPVWYTAIGPGTPKKSGHGLVNAPIVCAGARVEPGDLVVGGGDGVIVIPKAMAPEVVARARDRMEHEEGQRALIDAGEHPWHLHGGAANYAKMDVEEIDAPWRPSDK